MLTNRESSDRADGPAELVIRDLYEKHYRDAVKTIIAGYPRIGRSAEDVVQEATVNMYLKWEKLAAMPDEERRRYFFSAVHNGARTQLRRDARELPLEPGADRSPGADEQWFDDLRVRLALGQLPAEEREVAALACIAGLSTAEVADTLGVSRWTVARRLARAERKLASLDLTAAPGRPGVCHAAIA